MSNCSQKSFFGVRLVDVSLSEFTNHVIAMLKSEDAPVNIMSISLTSMRRFSEEMYNYAQSFSYVTADGNGFVKLSRFIGTPIRHQIAIASLSAELLNRASQQDLSVFLLGGTAAANQQALANVVNQYPGIRITGRDGYFDEQEMDSVAATIAAFKPDIVLVGISSPKKEQVIEYFSQCYGRSINVACGGFIDILAGKTKRAPVYIQKMALEWIYRFLQEPKRLFKPMLVDGLYFLIRLMPVFIYYHWFGSGDKKLYQLIAK